LIEVVLIAGAVFLGLLADEWRENRQQLELARGALERFRTEVAANKLAVAGVQEYHEKFQTQVNAFLGAEGPKTLGAFFARVDFKGVRAPNFEHTALDLALTTGSLGYIDPELAYEISRTYTAQSRLERLHDGFREQVLSPTTFATPDGTAFAIAIAAYLGEVRSDEPRLIEHYATLSAALDKALGGAPQQTGN